jgi:hypothetical protein
MRSPRHTRVLLAPAFASLLLLAACQQEEVTVEPGVEDQSGGELITVPADQEGVPVELPETPMTNVPVDSASPADPAAE